MMEVCGFEPSDVEVRLENELIQIAKRAEKKAARLQ